MVVFCPLLQRCLITSLSSNKNIYFCIIYIVDHGLQTPVEAFFHQTLLMTAVLKPNYFKKQCFFVIIFSTLGNNRGPGPSSLGVPGVPWHTQILADQLTLFQPGGTDYAHLIPTGTPGFSDLPTALRSKVTMEY